MDTGEWLEGGGGSRDLDLEEGGVRLVRLSDDGVGMSRDDLALCTLSHATSKIIQRIRRLKM